MTQQTKAKTRNVNIFFQLTRRHLLVFFKNKIRLMYTLLVPVIIFVVYIFFLRDLELTSVKSALAQIGVDKPELQDTVNVLMCDGGFWKRVSTLVDCWMISGILALSAITVSLQTNSVFVEDKQNGVNRDFASSPILRNILVTSYFFFNFIVTIVVCLAFLIICLIYLACMGEFALTFANFMTVLTVLLFSTVSSTLMTVFLCSFVKSEGPMAQGICGFIPGTYSCALLRYGFLSGPIAGLTEYLSGTLQLTECAPLIANLTDTFGYNLNFFGISVNPQYQSLAIAVFIVVFLALNIGVGKQLASVLGLGKKRRKKKSK